MAKPDHLSSTAVINITVSRQRSIIELYFLKNVRQRDIARILDVSQPYVSKTIRKFRSEVKKKLP